MPIQNYIYDGAIIHPYLSKLFLNSKLNPDFEESRIQGAVGLKRLSLYGAWVNINTVLLNIIQSYKNEYYYIK